MALFLTTDDCKALITMREAVDALDQAYRDLARHEATYRPRTDMIVPLRPREDYWLATMEGLSRTLRTAAIRLRSDRYSKTDRDRKWAGRPGLFCGLVILFDIETGEPLAIINDGYLQLMRVAATSAVGGRYLARPASHTLGIVGSGWQARDHARAFAATFPVERIKVYSPNPDHRAAFAAEMAAELNVGIDAVADVRAAVAGSDIVATCTRAAEPFLQGEWIEPGTYVASVRYSREIGSANARVFDVHAVHMREYGWLPYRAGTPEEWAQGCDIYDDFKGDALPDGTVSFDEIVSGTVPGRTSEGQRTLLAQHSGIGLQFAALGRIVYDRAVERGAGHEIPSEWFLQDITT